MSLATDTDLGLEIIEALDFEYTPPCESRSHETDPRAHGGDAYVLIRFRCPDCGYCLTGYRCKPFLAWVMADKPIRCDVAARGCGASLPASVMVTVLGFVGGS